MGELGQHAQVNADGLHQSLQALTIELPELSPGSQTAERRQILLNTDSDAYLEKTDWVAAGQALMGIDYNGDGQIEASELLSGDLAWLDANHDGRIDENDPAYRAIRLWNDVNGDGRSVHVHVVAQCANDSLFRISA